MEEVVGFLEVLLDDLLSSEKVSKLRPVVSWCVSTTPDSHCPSAILAGEIAKGLKE